MNDTWKTKAVRLAAFTLIELLVVIAVVFSGIYFVGSALCRARELRELASLLRRRRG